jgi:hypothetical protein
LNLEIFLNVQLTSLIMPEINARIKSFPEVWEQDKKLVRLSNPDLKIDWNTQLPNRQDAYSILLAKSQQWKNPVEIFQLNETTLAKVLDFLIPEVENAFGDKLLERPAIEILPRDKYLPRINDLERKTNAQFGYGGLCQSPPTMYHFASHGILLMPEKYLARVPKGSSRDVTSRNFDVIELLWDKPFFEEVLCEELSHVLFRQLRGEWKGDYVRSMKAIGPDGEGQISSINEVIAHRVKENITTNRKNKWGLYVASEKIAIAWQNRSGMNNYLCVDALSQNKTLAQIAMVDQMSVQSQQKIYVKFNTLHPEYISKKRKFSKKN